MDGIKVDFKVDTTNLNRAIAAAAQNSSRTISEICNRKLLIICSNAIKLTKKASKEAIKEALSNTELGYKVMETVRKTKGLYKDLPNDQALKRIINSRIRAINFIRSQWAWAVAMLIPYVKGKAVTVRKGGTVKGGAAPAQPVKTFTNTNVRASGWNDVHGSGGDPALVERIVVEGLQKAIDAETISTWEHWANETFQKKVCDKF